MTNLTQRAIEARNRNVPVASQTISLNQLVDVNVTGALANQVLTLSPNSNKWIAADPQGGGTSNIDGGHALTVYGGLDPIIGGTA